MSRLLSSESRPNDINAPLRIRSHVIAPYRQAHEEERSQHVLVRYNISCHASSLVRERYIPAGSIDCR